ncbi:MAG TPA: hypothetical protein VKA04_06620 [Pseudodesulfovibrio sp.]|nr:hypothetical protein [Pseudodesulfovibrio sp.]
MGRGEGEPSNLIPLADEALYKAKDNGRNGFQTAEAVGDGALSP